MKKNLAKLLAVSVSMGMLTACGGNGGKTETTAAETKAAETTAAETKAEETKETETTAAEKGRREIPGLRAVLRLHLPLSDHVLTGLFFYRGIRDLG